jgi:hypothetical protein
VITHFAIIISLLTIFSHKHEAHIITHIQQHIIMENLQASALATGINMATSVLQYDMNVLTLSSGVITRTGASKWNPQNMMIA